MSEARMKKVLEDFQQKAIAFQERTIESCYASNSENVNGFTKCLLKSMDQMEGIDKQISSLMMYAQIRTEKCVQGGKDAEFCTNSASKLIEDKLGEIGRSFS